MEVIKKHRDVNERMSAHLFFNTNATNPSYRNTKVSTNTLQQSNHIIDTTKCCGNSFDHTIEDTIRNTPITFKEDSELYTLNRKMVAVQKNESDFFSNVYQKNKHVLVEMDEKNLFNNHTRLY